ncbi:tetratricopeptide repeat protein [Thiocystis violacea]|uniref:tetratricopeptide repeat protein n=1 Tax=Thiocystis violacea TaxID=13725 RepID=UPI001906A7BB|nr:tetratricopeptide repeat protein [Thiocystis violacea]MBK1723537.1 hypothetical protein [Thiocystis violacea]
MDESNPPLYRAGPSGQAVWLLSNRPASELEPAVLLAEGEPEPRKLDWTNLDTPFLRKALSRRNLLPNGDFGGSGAASLDGWTGEQAQAPAIVAVDFGEDWRLRDRHTAYLFAPADAERPILSLDRPIQLLAGRELSYRCSGFFATHRCGGVVEFDLLDAQGAVIDQIQCPIPKREDLPGGPSLSDYRWLDWPIAMPAEATHARLRLRMGPHEGPGEATSFLFATHLCVCVVADDTPRLAWAPYSAGACELIRRVAQGSWAACALAEEVSEQDDLALVSEARLAVDAESISVQLERSSVGQLPDASAGVTDVLCPDGLGPVWISAPWPISSRFSIAAEPEAIQTSPSLLRTSGDFLAAALAGENLLENADFAEGFAHWNEQPGCGTDFNPSTRLHEGHTGYIYRKASDESDATTLCAEAILLPVTAGERGYQLSGYFGYHRCGGHLGVEWIADDGGVIERVQLQPSRHKALGGTELDDYDLQAAAIVAPAEAVAARVFIEKSATHPGEDGSFIFFTRLFFGLATRGSTAWRPRDQPWLERVQAFAKSAEHFQPMLENAVDLAEAAMRDGQWIAACQCWQRILDAAGASAIARRAYAGLADGLTRIRAFDDAEAVVREGLAAYPGDGRLLVQSAELATARRDWSRAAERWQQVLSAGRIDLPSRAYLEYVSALCEQQRYQDAERMISEAMARQPDDLLLHAGYAEISMAQQDWPEAIRRWQGLSQ